ncbi:MAG: GTP pyrophosphokinase family protein [Lachnospiraceae bacterium]|nr:GTP pyrophosphokinase family protein [Lachnospiraceae bacterium]
METVDTINTIEPTDTINAALTAADCSARHSATADSLTDTPLFLPMLEQQLDFDRHYRQLMYIHEAAISQITARLNTLKGEFQFSNDRNPIDSISSRIKSKESILYKMQQKGLPLTISALVENIHDIAGVRVVCPFIEDVYAVARMLVRQHGIDVIQVKDYIRNPKENGYRSLHMIVKTNVDFAETSKSITVEIQIRTIAMNFWASTEHQLRYKKNRSFTEEVQQKLKECADLMARADRQMQEIAGDFEEDQW